MTNTIERPAWAAETVSFDEGTQDAWHQFTRPMPATASMTDSGDREVYPATFTLQGSSLDRHKSLLLDGEGVSFMSPEQAREFASALHRAANEWERVNNEEFAQKLAANCERIGIDHGLTERQMSGVDSVYIHELALIMDRHDADGAELLRGTW